MKYLLFLLCVVNAAGQPAEKLLESAHHTAVINGDLKKAIAEYRQIADKFKRQPDIAAKALLQMGECQEKLGQVEARTSYERIVKDYAAVGNYASQAKARLMAMGGADSASVGSRTKLVWDDAIDFWGIVSADGRYLSHVDWSTGDLAIRDLKNGESRRITNYGGYEKALGEVESTSISPDGKRIVFNWDSWAPGAKENGFYQLRIVNADGTGERILRKQQKDLYFEANGWSSDSKWVAICESTRLDPNNSSAKIVLLSPDSGERRELPTSSVLVKQAITFSPDRKWLAYSEPVVRGGKKSNIYVISTTGAAQKESLVAQDAILMGWAPSGDALVFMRSAPGVSHLYTLDIKSGLAPTAPRRLHLPITEGATALGITSSGSLLYGTKNQTNEAALRKLSLKAGLSSDDVWTTPVVPIGYANNIGNPRFSPDGKWLASANSTQSIRIRSVESSNERILVTQGEILRFEWMPDGSSLIATILAKDSTKDSTNSLYRIDGSTGVNTFLCNIQVGRVFTPAADGKSVFHLMNSGLKNVELATGKVTPLIERDLSAQGPMSIRRSPDGKSLVLTTFAWIGIYDIASGSVKDLFKSPIEQSLNVGSVTVGWGADWSSDNQHVFAIVRADAESGDCEIWTYPVSGGQPKRQTQAGKIRDFATSPDGNYAAISVNHSHSQVWTLDNFLPAKQ